MGIIGRYATGRALFLAVLAVFAVAGAASAKTLCNQCKGTGKILEVTKQCPLHQPLFGHCNNCDGSGLVGPRCPYCGGVGYILTAAEKEAERKARAEADARAQAEHKEAMAKMAREDSIKAVERAKQASGARGKADIQRTIMQNMSKLRYAYNQRKKDVPALSGKAKVQFVIDEFGKVVSAQIVESTLNDAVFEGTIVAKLKSWEFESVDKPGDRQEVTWPFNFTD